MATADNTPSVIVKKKNINFIIDYCIENKIKFSVSPIGNKEDYEISFEPDNYISAINLGMALKELKIEPLGIHTVPLSAIKTHKQKEKPKNVSSEHISSERENNKRDDLMNLEQPSGELLPL